LPGATIFLGTSEPSVLGISLDSSMFGLRSKFVKSLVLGCCCLAGIQTASAYQGPAKKHKTAKAAAVVPAAPAAPEPAQPVVPPTLQQLPSTAPRVSYSNGQLTVIADNSTLGDVLRGVRDQTAADLEIPGNASDRVVGHFGPGAPRDVLADLLAGSHFNYVILGTVADPTKLERVILSPKPPPVEDNAAQTQANANGAPAPQAQAADTSNENATEDEDESSDSQGDQVNQPPAQAPVRTPEQLLQELQRQQQQQQQQQQPQQPQQQPDSTPPAPHQQN
jgi:hypothetical protein